MVFPLKPRKQPSAHHSSNHIRSKASRRRSSRRILCERLEDRRLLAADVLLADSFESGQWNGTWVEDSQNDWFDSSNRAFAGSYSAEVDGRATDAALTLADPIDLRAYDSAELTYAWRIKKNWDAGEYLAMDVFSGGSWQEAAKLRGNVDAENTWHEVTVDLGSHLTEDFKIRFRANVSGSREDGNVDDVKIVGTSAGSEFSIGDVTSVEGDSGTTEFAFTVTRGGDTSAAASVGYATADGTATTGDNDYVAAAGQLNFSAGEIEKTVIVDVAGDSVSEGAETFTVNLSAPSIGGSIVDGVGDATILNDDGADTNEFELSSLLAANGGDGSEGVVIAGILPNGALGVYNRMSVTGDINGDGIDDILIGVDRSGFESDASTSVYVVFGKAGGIGAEFDLATLDGTNGFRIDGSLDESITTKSEFFGDSIESVGDINGDGFDDLVIGAPEAASDGAVYVVLGAGTFSPVFDVDNLDGSNGFRIAGNTISHAQPKLGDLVGSAGDINGDGLGDILLQTASSDGGDGWVIFGSNAIGLPGASANFDLDDINGENGFMIDHFGTILRDPALVGDFNGDGIDDLARGESDSVRVLLGRQASAGDPQPFGTSVDLTALSGASGFSIVTSLSTGLSGSSVRSAGDLNDDGIDDIIIANSGGSPGGKVEAGEAFVVYGQQGIRSEFDVATIDGTNGVYIAGANAGDRAPSVSGVGDFNGDGIDDAAIISIYADPDNGVVDAGVVYVLYGNENGLGPAIDLGTLHPSQGLVINGFREAAWLSRMGSGSGDVNGDGRADFIVGARRADPGGIENAGELYVVYGREAGDPPVDTDPLLSISNSSVTEAASGTADMVFAVSLSETSDVDVQVDYASSDLTATAGADYQGVNGTLVIPAGQTNATLTIKVNADQPLEAAETMALTLSNPANALLGSTTGTGTIIDYIPPTKFYVADNVAPAIYKYEADGTYLGDYHGSFTGDFHARGIAATPDGTEIFYILSQGAVVRNGADGSSIAAWGTAETVKPEGIATDGEHLWIVDKGTDKIYFYEQGTSTTTATHATSTSSFALASGNKNPRGITTDGTNLWVVNSKSAKDEVFKYTMSGTLVGRWTIDTANVNPRGITIDPANVDHLWIVDSTTDSVYQYSGAASRTSGSQSADDIFALAAGNTNPQGIADPPPPSAAGSSVSASSATATPLAIPPAAGSSPDVGLSIEAAFDQVLEQIAVRKTASFDMTAVDSAINALSQPGPAGETASDELPSSLEQAIRELTAPL